MKNCEPSIDECSMLVIYSDGDYGYDIVLGMTKNRAGYKWFIDLCRYFET